MKLRRDPQTKVPTGDPPPVNASKTSAPVDDSTGTIFVSFIEAPHFSSAGQDSNALNSPSSVHGRIHAALSSAYTAVSCGGMPEAECQLKEACEYHMAKALRWEGQEALNQRLSVMKPEATSKLRDRFANYRAFTEGWCRTSIGRAKNAALDMQSIATRALTVAINPIVTEEVVGADSLSLPVPVSHQHIVCPGGCPEAAKREIRASIAASHPNKTIVYLGNLSPPSTIDPSQSFSSVNDTAWSSLPPSLRMLSGADSTHFRRASQRMVSACNPSPWLYQNMPNISMWAPCTAADLTCAGSWLSHKARTLLHNINPRNRGTPAPREPDYDAMWIEKHDQLRHDWDVALDHSTVASVYDSWMESLYSLFGGNVVARMYRNTAPYRPVEEENRMRKMWDKVIGRSGTAEESAREGSRCQTHEWVVRGGKADRFIQPSELDTISSILETHHVAGKEVTAERRKKREEESKKREEEESKTHHEESRKPEGE